MIILKLNTILARKVLSFCTLRFCLTTCPDLLTLYLVVLMLQHTKQTDQWQYLNLTYFRSLIKCNFPLISIVKSALQHTSIFFLPFVWGWNQKFGENFYQWQYINLTYFRSLIKCNFPLISIVKSALQHTSIFFLPFVWGWNQKFGENFYLKSV